MTLSRRSVESRCDRYLIAMLAAVAAGDENVAFLGARLYTHWLRVLARMNAAGTFRLMEGRPTNAQFATSNARFMEACAAAEIAPAKRQASKWRNGRGVAFDMLRAETA